MGFRPVLLVAVAFAFTFTTAVRGPIIMITAAVRGSILIMITAVVRRSILIITAAVTPPLMMVPFTLIPASLRLFTFSAAAFGALAAFAALSALALAMFLALLSIPVHLLLLSFYLILQRFGSPFQSLITFFYFYSVAGIPFIREWSCEMVTNHPTLDSPWSSILRLAHPTASHRISHHFGPQHSPKTR